MSENAVNLFVIFVFFVARFNGLFGVDPAHQLTELAAWAVTPRPFRSWSFCNSVRMGGQWVAAG
jgi:hypothetical protein